MRRSIAERRLVRGRWARGAIGAAVVLAVCAAWAQRPSRDDVQAAYLYNFGKFVRWPGAERNPMLVCVAGQDSFGKTIAKLVDGEQIDGRSLTERNVSSPERVGDCSILYIGSGEQEREESYLAAADGKPILTVGEAPDFLAHGGMIQFVMMENHVRFSVNLDAVNRHRVALSSELLKVAVAVTGKPETGGAR